MKTTWAALFLVGALASPAFADRADDDLAAIRRAVGGTKVARAEEPRAAEAEPPAARRATRAADARWFRVRIVEKTGKRAKVSVNLPLGLVRAIGEDWPLHDRHHSDGKEVTLGEVLRSLDAGQSLVEIEDEDATVRVWVD